jgi:AraC family transcriptional regulator
MNNVVEYIEKNLTEYIDHNNLCKIVGCSRYEFSRIFSFMAGMSISEYIRRRRLSQAVFDIQDGKDKIIDIALKYCYESQAAFTRGFKEIHRCSPLSARKKGIPLKTYPPISFKLIITGVNEMNFRIETKDSFKIIGYSCDNGDMKDWRFFLENYNERLGNGDTGDTDGPDSYYHAPLWQVGANKFKTSKYEKGCIIGAELASKPVLKGMDVETIPKATWAVFTITSKSGTKESEEAFTRVFAEWLPASSYVRDENVPTLDVYPAGDVTSGNYKWEIWLPVKAK